MTRFLLIFHTLRMSPKELRKYSEPIIRPQIIQSHPEKFDYGNGQEDTGGHDNHIYDHNQYGR